MANVFRPSHNKWQHKSVNDRHNFPQQGQQITRELDRKESKLKYNKMCLKELLKKKNQERKEHAASILCENTDGSPEVSSSGREDHPEDGEESSPVE